MGTERTFRTSSHSNTQSTCVASSVGVRDTLVRDSKAPDAGLLTFGRAAWLAAVGRVTGRGAVS